MKRMRKATLPLPHPKIDPYRRHHHHRRGGWEATKDSLNTVKAKENNEKACSKEKTQEAKRKAKDGNQLSTSSAHMTTAVSKAAEAQTAAGEEGPVDGPTPTLHVSFCGKGEFNQSEDCIMVRSLRCPTRTSAKAGCTSNLAHRPHWAISGQQWPPVLVQQLIRHLLVHQTSYLIWKNIW